MPLAALAAIGIAGSIGGAAIGAHAAGKAADTQAAAADRAAELQSQSSREALDFQKQQWNQQQANEAPWLKSGSEGLANLDYLLGIKPPTTQGTMTGAAGGTTDLGGMVNPDLGAFGSLMQPYGKTFTAPDGLTEQNDPGFQARLKLGTDTLQRSAAARGNLLTGGTAKALDTYAQDYASNEYGNVYNRALSDFGTNYNLWSQHQANEYNRLASLAGVGQTTANQLATGGQNAANAMSSNVLGTAASMGQQYNNAAAANASGYVGGANAWGGAANGMGNNLQQLLMLKQMGMFPGGSSGGGSGNMDYLGEWA